MTYIIAPEAVQKIVRSRTIKLIWVFATQAILLLAIVTILRYQEPNGQLFYISLIVIATLSVGFILTYKRVLSSITTEITVEGNSLLARLRSGKQVTIHRSDVKRFQEIEGKGLLISSRFSRVRIFVPNELQNYDRLKSELVPWAQNTYQRKESFKIPIFFISGGILFIGLGLLLALEYPLDGWKPVVVTLLLLLWSTFVTWELFLGVAVLALGGVERQDNPALFWVIITVQCIPILGFPYYYVTTVLSHDIIVIIISSALIALWITVAMVLVFKKLQKYGEKV